MEQQNAHSLSASTLKRFLFPWKTDAHMHFKLPSAMFYNLILTPSDDNWYPSSGKCNLIEMKCWAERMCLGVGKSGTHHKKCTSDSFFHAFLSVHENDGFVAVFWLQKLCFDCIMHRNSLNFNYFCQFIGFWGNEIPKSFNNFKSSKIFSN